MKIGIVGLPNAGKSTLFNALTKKRVAASNYPFCTIEPNLGAVKVPDQRLEKLAALSKSEKIITAMIEFVDIAGLVRDAHKGQGLGNKFLSHIKEVDAILQVVRSFESKEVAHVEGRIDPLTDISIINLELAMADLELIVKRTEALRPQAKTGDKESLSKLKILEKIKAVLDQGRLAKDADLSPEELIVIKECNLLTLKPIIYVLNCRDFTSQKDKTALENFSRLKSTIEQKFQALCLLLDIKLESDLAELPAGEAQEYLKEFNLENFALDQLIKTCYQTLGLITFLTTGPKETRAWTVKIGDCAPAAAGKIHSDFEKNFIRAEVMTYPDLIKAGSWSKAAELGLLRIEGKNYIMQDGDVIFFRVGV